MDSHWLEALVKAFDKENRISKVLSIEKKDALAKGENYTSRVYRGTLKVILNSGSQITKGLIIKEVSTQKTQKVLKELNLFKVETKIYQNVLKGMEGLMNDYGDTGDTLWCDMLGYKPYNVIVLDDLTLKGYKVADRKECLNLEHSLLATRSMAKFHALSKILLENGIVANDDLGKFWAEQEMGKNWVEGGLRQLSKVMIDSWPAKWKSIGLKLQAQEPIITEKLKSLIKLQDDGFHVVNHGDPWTNNIMFKYTPFNKQPAGIKFVDFQTCHYNSYMFDMIYFFFTSIKPDLRRKHIDEILAAYHEAMEYYLKFFSYQGKIPSLNDVKSEYERLRSWSLACLVTVHIVATSETKDAFDMEKVLPGCDFFKPEGLARESLIKNIGADLELLSNDGII